MATSLLDEGAGPYDAMAFHERLERKAIELSFRSGRDYFRGTLRTLKENRDEAFDYLRLALTEPRFDAADGRADARADHVAAAARDHEPERHREPQLVGDRPFPAIPTGGRSTARSNSLPRITVDDLKAYTRPRAGARAISRSRWSATSTPRPPGELLDRTFGALPAKAELDAGRRTWLRKGSAAASSSSSTCRRRW